MESSPGRAAAACEENLAQWLICYICKCSIEMLLQPFPPKTARLLEEQRLSLSGPSAKALQPWPWSCFHAAAAADGAGGPASRSGAAVVAVKLR